VMLLMMKASLFASLSIHTWQKVLEIRLVLSILLGIRDIHVWL
jgi:hypothetical protein